MKTLRTTGTLFLALILAVALSACAKKTEDQLTTTDSLSQSPPTDEYTTPTPEGTTPSSPAPTTPPRSTTPSRPRTPAVPASERRTVSLPTGATFDVEMVTPVNSGSANVGDRIEAKLLQSLTSPEGDGTVMAEAGSRIWGQVAEVRRASRAKSEEERAMVRMEFTSLETVDGEKTINTTVTNAEGRMIAGSTTKRDALIIGGSTVAGAIIGKVVGKDTKGTVIGAVGGAILGTGAVMAAKGYELDVPAGSKVTLRVDSPVTVVAR